MLKTSKFEIQIYRQLVDWDNDPLGGRTEGGTLVQRRKWHKATKTSILDRTSNDKLTTALNLLGCQVLLP
jgi:hypothetical protein